MKKIFLALVCCITTLQLSALTVTSGSTLTIGMLNLTENIIVEPDATLIINGDLVFGHPVNTDEYYILIQDKGKVLSTGGSISGLDLGGGNKRQWYGIVVEATDAAAPTLADALFLDNFRLEDARHAIECPRYSSVHPETVDLINRGLTVQRTDFDNNVMHFNMGGGHLFGTTFGVFNRDNGVNTLRFLFNNFYGAENSWPFWITNTSNVVVSHCLYDDDMEGADIGIHFNDVKNGDINHCEFKRTGSCGIVLHGLNDNVKVNFCDFTLTSTTHPTGFPESYRGVGIGNYVNYGAVKKFEAGYNSFNYDITAPNTFGMVVGDGGGVPGGAPSPSSFLGYLHSAEIRNNSFYGVNYAISISNSSSSASNPIYSGLSHEILIFDNQMDQFFVGVELCGHQTETWITCNLFNQGEYGFSLDNELGVLAPCTVPHYNTGVGSKNGYISCSTDLINSTSTTFQYQVSASNLWPPTIISGLLLMGSVLPGETCFWE